MLDDNQHDPCDAASATSAALAASQALETSSAALFDCDGLLVDSAPLWQAAEHAVVTRYGGQWSTTDHEALRGLSFAAAVRVLTSRTPDQNDEDTILADLLAHYTASARHGRIMPMPGARQLLETLHGHLPIAVVSNSPDEVLEPVLRSAGLRQFVGTVIGANNVSVGKPAPDLYLEACRRLELHPSRCTALEDSPTGVTSATRAGCQVIGVSPSGSLPPCHHISTLLDLL